MIITIIITTIIITKIKVISKKASLYLKSLKYNFNALWACLDIILKKLLYFVTPLDSYANAKN